MRNTLIEHFKSGCKAYSQTLGLEVEHFICYKDTLEAVPYEGIPGIKDILIELASYFPDAVILKGGPLLGFDTDKFSITLEPAAQLEISILPTENIISLTKIYSHFLITLSEVLKPHNMVYKTFGYQPKSKVSSLPLIPKERYTIMDSYFKSSGTMGINMMRGTASIHLSIDYRDEDDFRNKFQAAYVLSPYLKLLTENSPVFEGQQNSMHLLRSHIWNNTDRDRCGIIPNVMSTDYGFSDYADYVLNAPKLLPEDDIDTLLSIVFPDIRLKTYIEIRVSDSLPFDLAMSYCALIKGIFYSKEAMNYVTDLIRENNITIEDIVIAEKSVSKDGKKGTIYGIPLCDFHNKIFKLAENGLHDDEKDYLQPLGEKFYE